MFLVRFPRRGALHRTLCRAAPGAPGVLARLDALVARGAIAANPAQQRLAQRLDTLRETLATHRPVLRALPPSRVDRLVAERLSPDDPAAPASADSAERTAMLRDQREAIDDESVALAEEAARKGGYTLTAASWGHRERYRVDTATPRGLYVHGAVGAGKSMLMDLFYASVEAAPARAEPGPEGGEPSTPLQGPAKSRMHYNDFVRRVHETCHAYRQATARIIKEGGNGSGRLVPHSEDAVPYAARSFVETHGWLLCFDEFQVPDPADSVIIGRMLGFMMEHGAVIVATSNRSIDELAGTLFDRHLFTPFARIMADRCDNVRLDAGVDFRARAAEEAGRLGPEHLSPLPAYTSDRAAFDDAWRCAVAAEVAGPGQEHGNGDGANASQDRETDGTAACEIPAFSVGYGRTIRVPASCGGSAQFDFRGLLTAALGASDYARIAERFHTVFVSDVPALNLGSRDAARRLITLVDELYERRCRLVLHGAVDMPSLFEGDRGEVDAMSIDDGIVEFLTPEQLESSLFTGEDEVFAFRRCLSRLAEMGTRAYWHAGEGRPY